MGRERVEVADYDVEVFLAVILDQGRKEGETGGEEVSLGQRGQNGGKDSIPLMSPMHHRRHHRQLHQAVLVVLALCRPLCQPSRAVPPVVDSGRPGGGSRPRRRRVSSLLCQRSVHVLPSSPSFHPPLFLLKKKKDTYNSPITSSTWAHRSVVGSVPRGQSGLFAGHDESLSSSLSGSVVVAVARHMQIHHMCHMRHRYRGFRADDACAGGGPGTSPLGR